MNNLFWIFIILLAIQRIIELMHARKNETVMLRLGAIEYDKNGYKVIVLMHVLFFVSIILERTFLDRGFNKLSIYFFVIFLSAQILRYWTISSLGKFWNTKILVLPKAGLVKHGPYRYLKHPNYLAVIIEIATIPLMFSCYLTFLIFSLLNLILLKRRTKIEERAMGINL